MRKRPHDFFDEHIRGIYIRDQKIGRGSGRRQAFVKITGRSYTSRTVVASLRYIGKESDGVGKDTRVIDENGKEIKPADFKKAVKEWDFNPEIDRRNESKGTRERKTRLTTQFVVSFPKSCSLSVRQTEDFMDAFMLPHREKGAKYFIAVHTEQGSRHAHVHYQEQNGVRGTADFRPQKHTGVAATASRSREVLRHPVGKHACLAKAGRRPIDQKDAFGTASSGMAR